jgi:GrpB-like predicted nucleotidyltransferase (UPF0157 family)
MVDDERWLALTAPAVVVPYNPLWPAQFEALRALADVALGTIPHVTEHVGSTAVPGLDAKPIIDIDVVVRSADVISPAAEALVRAGWQHEGDLGIPGREAFARHAMSATTICTLWSTAVPRIATTSTCATTCARIPTMPARMGGTSAR